MTGLADPVRRERLTRCDESSEIEGDTDRVGFDLLDQLSKLFRTPQEARCRRGERDSHAGFRAIPRCLAEGLPGGVERGLV